MKDLDQRNQNSFHYMALLGGILCVACLGVASLVYGFLPLSPSLFAHSPLLSFTLYFGLLLSFYLLESYPTPQSPIPYSAEDPHLHYYLYLGLTACWAGVILPICWLSLGAEALQGASLDEQISAHPNWVFSTAIGWLVVYLLRQKAVEEKDYARTNRKSPPVTSIQQSHNIDPNWNTSDVWDAVPMTNEDLVMVSARDKENYRRRREDKLSGETQELQSLRLNEALSTLTHQQRVSSTVFKSSSDLYSSSSLYTGDPFDSPAWSNQSMSSSLGINDQSLNSSIRRSVDDYDTRFDQSVIHGGLSHHEILADNGRWSGVSRPVKLPLPRHITAGYTPLSLVDSPVSPLTEGSISHERDLSEDPTTPPQGVEPLSLAFPESDEDLALLNEVSQMINMIDQPESPATEFAQDPFASSSESSPLLRVSFSQLSELSHPQVDDTRLDLLNPTLVDQRTWTPEYDQQSTSYQHAQAAIATTKRSLDYPEDGES